MEGGCVKIQCRDLLFVFRFVVIDKNQFTGFETRCRGFFYENIFYIFFPISWMSPSTVAIRTRPFFGPYISFNFLSIKILPRRGPIAVARPSGSGCC
jgi:hypothetical protein